MSDQPMIEITLDGAPCTIEAGSTAALVLQDAVKEDGVPHAWDLILTSGKDSVAYYGASSNESRTFRGAEALDWWAACTLAQEGYRGLDLMGAGSTRVPSLYTVGQYKKRYAQHVTEVDGAWDIPVSRVIYSGMCTAKRLRDALRARRGSRED